MGGASGNTTDYGIATFATSGINIQGYAVEAEGLTATPGDMSIDQVKNSWNGRGFRFGTVGFGSQYRPTANVGNTAVAVGGVVSKGSNHGGWIATGEYQARIGGSTDKNALVNNNTSGASSASQNSNWWNTADPLNVQGDDHDNPGSQKSVDYSNFAAETFTNKDSLLNTFNSFSTDTTLTGMYRHTVTDADVSTYLGSVTRNRYDYQQSGQTTGYTATFNVTEKVITFTGDDSSSLQVFSLPASYLSGVGVSDGNTGVSWDFENIADGASVVVNITGSGSGLTFRNGWRFVWNGTDIGNGYSNTASDTVKKAYVSAAEHVMWNFASTGNVTVLGGKATNATVKGDKTVSLNGAWGYGGASFTASSTDDPAAAMIGSILVNGDFADHVTTNGRMYVNGTFTMVNSADDVVKNGSGEVVKYSEGDHTTASTSIINMDQERHNFPWATTYSVTCATLTWNKVDSVHGQTLHGSQWGIYSTDEAAQVGSDSTSDSTLIAKVTDGTFTSDADNKVMADTSDTAADGVLKVENLAPNATYYIRELTAPTGYSLNTTVYTVTVGAGGTTTTLAGDDGNGNIKDALLPGTVSWSKKAGTVDGADLTGSVWKLSKCADDSGIAADCKSWNDERSDISSTTAQFTIDDIKPNALYKLVETSAPAGYATAGPFYFTGHTNAPTYFTDEEGNNLAASDSYKYDSDSGVNYIADARILGTVTWNKVEADGVTGNLDTATLLSGSSWAFYASSDDAANQTNAMGTVTDCTGTCPASTAAAPYVDTNSIAGQFAVTNLAWGTYYVREAAAPAGYNLNDTVFTVTIDATHTSVKLTDGITDDAARAAALVDAAGNIGDKEKTYHLPNTGRWGGVSVIMTAGFLALLGGAALVLRLTRKSQD
ncbi:SpaA isopeptide-forming pilin-related protein [Pseudoscardovia suis]|uniref:Cna protein B-type domain-containing protein n=1 Tax=Pseudoscardovia suis TaxID=987063 RepID=A0A261EX43_9BIFI|nr:SpaA isopeptide-forming pilin-related protein [Pseudoscardovia suis]OZG51421.1 Cna protein B-type domain-containing protein [Pseudoscardovia suis]PJJ68696.1 choice-of-anchor A domain-containing protein [Pseudoscardovia suis]